MGKVNPKEVQVLVRVQVFKGLSSFMWGTDWGEGTERGEKGRTVYMQTSVKSGRVVLGRNVGFLKSKV